MFLVRSCILCFTRLFRFTRHRFVVIASMRVQLMRGVRFNKENRRLVISMNSGERRLRQAEIVTVEPWLVACLRICWIHDDRALVNGSNSQRVEPHEISQVSSRDHKFLAVWYVHDS